MCMERMLIRYTDEYRDSIKRKGDKTGMGICEHTDTPRAHDTNHYTVTCCVSSCQVVGYTVFGLQLYGSIYDVHTH